MLNLLIFLVSNITHSVKDGMRQRAASNNFVKNVNPALNDQRYSQCPVSAGDW